MENNFMIAYKNQFNGKTVINKETFADENTAKKRLDMIMSDTSVVYPIIYNF